MLNKEDFIDDAAKIGCSVAAIQAVAEVESKGSGFDPEEFPVTLFEGHWFYRYTGGKFAESYPSLCYQKWTKQFYGKTWKEEKARLNQAIQLDRTSALMSASWGMFQIMGFNFSVCGFKSVQLFVNAMCKNENEQLAAFTNYVINSGLADELRRLDWDKFAYLYNGPEYQKNQYAQKLARAYEKHV